MLEITNSFADLVECVASESFRTISLRERGDISISKPFLFGMQDMHRRLLEIGDGMLEYYRFFFGVDF